MFAVDIAHLETLTEVFRKYGYDARGLSSKTSDVERAQLLKDFRDRKFPIIVNCGILTEGTGKTCFAITVHRHLCVPSLTSGFARNLE